MSVSLDLPYRKSYGPRRGWTIGTTGDGVSADHYSADGHNIVTRLTVSQAMPAIVGGTNLSVGLLIYTFPAGVHALKSVRMAISLQQTEGNVDADTPEIGLGDTVGSGANTQLSSVGASENILTGQVADDCDGTVEDFTILVSDAGHLINNAAGTKTLWLNVADGWASGGDAALLAAGEVWLSWTRFTTG